ncbi:MAG: hypothetical protein HZA06_01265 [Nitrospirae bacterium]|nr:hypothetical protein [Nitrospirota bacterium]
MQGYKSGVKALYQGLTILFVLSVFLLFPKISLAATINATSCSASDVQTAINAASDGDTVSVPAGSCTWSSRLSFTKGITLQGAGSGITIIKGNYTYNNGDDSDPLNYLISYVPDATARTNDTPFRLTGFTIDPDNKCAAVLI